MTVLIQSLAAEPSFLLKCVIFHRRRETVARAGNIVRSLLKKAWDILFSYPTCRVPESWRQPIRSTTTLHDARTIVMRLLLSCTSAVRADRCVVFPQGGIPSILRVRRAFAGLSDTRWCVHTNCRRVNRHGLTSDGGFRPGPRISIWLIGIWPGAFGSRCKHLTQQASKTSSTGAGEWGSFSASCS